MNDEQEQKEDEKFLEELENMEDEFLTEYRQRRIEEMRKALENIPKFGRVVVLTADNFLQEIDKEKAQVTVVVHIYEDAENGVPALLVYKNGELVGNFLQLSKEFGDDFYATDVESFLEEHGFLPSKLLMPVVRDKTTGEIRSTLPQDEDSGSDFDID
nr:hypothetical protein BaRGS_026133 [Batillaria attramentaria]